MKLVFVTAALLTACANPPSMTASIPVPAELHGVMPAMLDDAARRIGVPASRLRVEVLEAVVWRDGALGCPQPGRLYPQVLVPGYRVQIAAHDAGAVALSYHVGRRGAWLHCPTGQAQSPLPRDADPRI